MPDAKVINLAEWKAAHPPVLLIWQHHLAALVAWQLLWLSVIYGRPIK